MLWQKGKNFIKFFTDSAIIDEIKGLNGFDLLDGITTTASLIAKPGRDFNEVITEILPSLTGWIKGPFPKLSVTDSNFKLNANAFFADIEILEPVIQFAR